MDNDNFIHLQHQNPSEEFGTKLLNQLKANEKKRQNKRLRIAKFSIIPLFILGFILSSSTARASIEQLIERTIQQIAGQQIEFVSSLEEPDSVEIIEGTYKTIAEARAMYDFRLPTYLPEGFKPVKVKTGSGWFQSSSSKAAVENGADFVYHTDFTHFQHFILNWKDTQNNGISLNISSNANQNYLVGEEVEEVVIRSGLTGLTNLGTWNGDVYEVDQNATLRWVEGDWIYYLSGLDKTVTLEMLIKMANSLE